MKKHILLTTTAMLLSAIATNTNAASNSATLQMMVSLLEPFEFSQEEYLSFGTIIDGTEAGKTVIVMTDGKLDPNSTATLLSQTSSQGTYGPGFDNLREGVFRIKNSAFNFADEIDEDLLNEFFLVSFDAPSVEMMGGGGKCGTASNFTTRLKKSTKGEVKLHVGGTFTTAGMSNRASCGGSTTVTIVFNDAFLETLN